MKTDIVEVKCDGCGTMRKWRGYKCLTFCVCLADTQEIDYGKDEYYREWAEEQSQEEREREE